MEGLIYSIEKLAWGKGLVGSDFANKEMFLGASSKIIEEVCNSTSEITNGDLEGIKRGVGDVVAIMIVLAMQNGLTLEECLTDAYNDMKTNDNSRINKIYKQQ